MQHRYPEMMIAPMRAEMTALGARELRTTDEVDDFMEEASEGTALLVINSVCGCSASSMRPGLAAALERIGAVRLGTVFAGADLEATERARELFAPHPPSSPFIGVFHDGRMTGALERSDIKGIAPEAVTRALIELVEEPSTV